MTVDSARAKTAGAQSVVLFDFDGVLFKGDAFTALMRHHCTRAWWRVVLASPLLLVTLPFLWLRRTRSGAVRFIVRLALLGFSLSRYRTLAQDFGRTLARDARHFSRQSLAALNAHRHAGARVIVVSGCEETLARTILDELGLGQIELVASRLAEGRFGVRVAVRNVGVEKAHQLGRRGVRPPWDVAYSDSLADLPILAAARSAFLVNPDRQMLARVSPRLKGRLSIVEWQ
jgi:phosphatidylglycerophosphatase C